MEFLPPFAVIVGAIASIGALTAAIRAWSLQHNFDTIVREPVAPEVPQPKPLTEAEKIDALYQLSKRQGRLQLLSNLGWAIFGIAGGYLAGHFLPH